MIEDMMFWFFSGKEQDQPDDLLCKVIFFSRKEAKAFVPLRGKC
jgi:hypothetical protein